MESNKKNTKAESFFDWKEEHESLTKEDWLHPLSFFQDAIHQSKFVECPLAPIFGSKNRYDFLPQLLDLFLASAESPT